LLLVVFQGDHTGAAAGDDVHESACLNLRDAIAELREYFAAVYADTQVDENAV
jgi:hypothetical protein